MSEEAETATKWPAHPFCQACQSIPAAGYCDLAGCPNAARHEPPTSLQLGLWAPTLREQGFDLLLKPDVVDRYMAHDTAISRLFTAGLITEGVHVRAREKLADQIRAALAPPKTVRAG